MLHVIVAKLHEMLWPVIWPGFLAIIPGLHTVVSLVGQCWPLPDDLHCKNPVTYSWLRERTNVCHHSTLWSPRATASMINTINRAAPGQFWTIVNQKTVQLSCYATVDTL